VISGRGFLIVPTPAETSPALTVVPVPTTSSIPLIAVSVSKSHVMKSKSSEGRIPSDHRLCLIQTFISSFFGHGRDADSPRTARDQRMLCLQRISTSHSYRIVLPTPNSPSLAQVLSSRLLIRLITFVTFSCDPQSCTLSGRFPAVKLSQTRCAALAMLLIAAAGKSPAQSGYTVIPVTNGGTITGTVKWSGPEPRGLDVPVNKDLEICDPESRQRINLERMVIGPYGGVANTIVYLNNISHGKAMNLPSPRRSLDQKHCRYEPHILWVPQNAELAMKKLRRGTTYSSHGRRCQL
jgi:hypothetical protein